MNKDKMLGELMQLRFDIKGFEDLIREGNHQMTLHDQQLVLKDYTTRVQKIMEELMDEMPAHEHLRDE